MTTSVTTAITKELMMKLRTEIDAALRKVCTDNPGIAANLINGKYNATSGTFKLLLVANNDSSAGQRSAERIKAERDFTAKADLWMMKPEWLGQQVKGANGNQYRIVGLYPRRSRYPVLCEPLAGGTPKLFPAETIISQLKAK